MSLLASKMSQTDAKERRLAIRDLLAHPFVTAASDAVAFARVVRHRDWLGRWFSEQAGWKLVVEPHAGIGRLHKVPARQHFGATLDVRPATLTGKPPFDRRRYVLLVLTLAALDDGPAQTTLRRLAEVMRDASNDDPTMIPFDATSFAERRAFVDVLRWLVGAGVLRERDGDAEGYAQDASGDALYDVSERHLAHLVAAPVPPSLAASPGAMLVELYPDTEDGQVLRARHTVFRRVLDDPVMYYEDLDEREMAWLDHSRAFVYQKLEEAGFRVERRREGLAAVDPEGEVTDILFPDGGSTVKHVALLCAAQLADRRRRTSLDEIDDEDLLAMVADLVRDYAMQLEQAVPRRRWRAPATRRRSDVLALTVSPRRPNLERMAHSARHRTILARGAVEQGATFVTDVTPSPSMTDALLPRPTRSRWQLLRAGIQNVWEYDDQRFVLRNGRLVLRGRNESGKTKAIEVLLPFLLDADLAPERLDPFGSTSRLMRWNLIRDTNPDSGTIVIGYVWLEFARRGEADEFFTIGAGLKARRSDPRVESWFFTTSQRVDDDLHPMEYRPSEGRRVPLVRKRLEDAIGGKGAVYDERDKYRRVVNDRLFGLAESQYDALVEMLLQLRRPQLSAKLDPEGLSEILTASLPPLDAGVISPLAEGFERLDRHQAERDEHDAALQEIRKFLDVYRRYVQTAAKARALELTRAESVYQRRSGISRACASRCLPMRDRQTSGLSMKRSNLLLFPAMERALAG